MVVIFLVLVAYIITGFFCMAAFAATMVECLIEYSQLIGLWLLFNTAFIIQSVIAIISKFKKKKFGKGNVIRTIIFGTITFVLFVVTVILIFLKNYKTVKELCSAWVH